MQILVVIVSDWFDLISGYYIVKKLKLSVICNLTDDRPNMIVNFLQILGSLGKFDWKCGGLISWIY